MQPFESAAQERLPGSSCRRTRRGLPHEASGGGRSPHTGAPLACMCTHRVVM